MRNVGPRRTPEFRHSAGLATPLALQAEAAECPRADALAMELALNGVATTTPSTPFFRFPFFEMSQSSLDHLQKRGIMVFGAGVFADDRIKAPADAQLKRIVEREAAAKGILLLHDSEEHTAAVLPAFLRYLRDNRYRVGHVVSRTPAKATAGTKT